MIDENPANCGLGFYFGEGELAVLEIDQGFSEDLALAAIFVITSYSIHYTKLYDWLAR